MSLSCYLHFSIRLPCGSHSNYTLAEDIHKLESGEEGAMDIRTLEEYIVFSRHMNMTSAAKELNLSISSLSRHISAMEKELGVDLVRHSKSKMTLTVAGSQVLEEACEIVSRYNTLLNRLSSQKSSDGKIRIAYALDDRVMIDAISVTLSELKKQGAKIAIESSAIRDKELFKALQDDDIDIIISYDTIDKPEDSSLESVLLLTDTLLVVLPAELGMVNSKKVTPSDISDRVIPWASAARDDYLSRVLRLFSNCNQQPHVRWVDADDMDTFYQHLLKKREMWFFSKKMYEDYYLCISAAYRKSVTAHELEGVDTTFTRHAIYKRNNKAAKYIAQALKDIGFGKQEFGSV